MPGILPMVLVAFAACMLSAQDAAMRITNPLPYAADQGSGERKTPRQRATAPALIGQGGGSDRLPAAQGSIPESVSAKDNLLPPTPKPEEVPADALGRRILSTAFVRLGPDEHLMVELRNGSVLLLRNVVMHSKKYCGRQSFGARYCGSYAEVAAARSRVRTD